MDNIIETVKEKVEEVLHLDEKVPEEVSPTEEVPSEEPVAEVQPEGEAESVADDEAVDDGATEPVVADRSAFNCPDCGGLGLENGNVQDKLCNMCQGTGKV